MLKIYKLQRTYSIYDICDNEVFCLIHQTVVITLVIVYFLYYILPETVIEHPIFTVLMLLFICMAALGAVVDEKERIAR